MKYYGGKKVVIVFASDSTLKKYTHNWKYVDSIDEFMTIIPEYCMMSQLFSNGMKWIQ